MISILVTGISGRMGQAVQEAVTQNPDTCVGATYDQGQELYPALAKCDVAIDFSHHAFTSTLLAEAVANNKPLVIGTTGHTELERQEIMDAAASIPIVFASNYSAGVNALFWLTRKAAQILGGSCDIEVMEMHHRHKIDAPSGTARTLAEILSGAIGRNYEDSVVFGREGLVGPRPANEIGMHSLRGGDVVGDHTVVFASDGERLELTHKASSRMTFASGAVRAALWLQGREPGLYTMEDVLGLSHFYWYRIMVVSPSRNGHDAFFADEESRHRTGIQYGGQKQPDGSGQGPSAEDEPVRRSFPAILPVCYQSAGMSAWRG